MTSEELFAGTTRTVTTDEAPFGDDDCTVRGSLEELAAANEAAATGAPLGDADGGDYDIEVQRGAPDTAESPLPPVTSDEWTEHKVLPDETRRQMQLHKRPESAAGAIGGGGGAARAAMNTRATIASVVAATPESASPSELASDDPFKTAITSPSRMVTEVTAQLPRSVVDAVAAQASEALPPADAAAWSEADAPTRACLELPDLQRGAVYVPAANAASPDDATRVWDPAVALLRPPEWTLDLRTLYRTTRSRLAHAWATRRRLFVLVVAVIVAASVVGGLALRPARARPLAASTRPQPRRPPALHPAPAAARAAASAQDVELLAARAVVAYDTGRRVEAAELFHTLSELQPDDAAWQFMSDILDRANNGGVTP